MSGDGPFPPSYGSIELLPTAAANASSAAYVHSKNNVLEPKDCLHRTDWLILKLTRLSRVRRFPKQLIFKDTKCRKNAGLDPKSAS